MKYALSFLRRNLDDSITLIAGNVAVGESALRLVDCGADCIKVGIGPGAVCSTRRVTGYGIPQFSAILDCAEILDIKGYNNIRIIADGGLRHPGDAAKAIWAGADAVMAGYIFAGYEQCPKIDGDYFYRGMSSRNVSQRHDIAAEGVSIKVDSKGSVSTLIQEWSASLKSACSMANAWNLQELRRNVEAIRVSTMSNAESDPVGGE
jgi:IMP dehydrogenase